MKTKTLITTGAIAALTLGLAGTAFAESTPAPTPTKTVQWVLAPGSTTSAPFAGGAQHLYTGQCGNGTIQTDTYKYATPQQIDLVNRLVTSGVLDHYEDSPVFLSVSWSKQTPCAPVVTPTPTPVPTQAPAPQPVPKAAAPVVPVPRAVTPAAPAVPVPTTARFTG